MKTPEQILAKHGYPIPGDNLDANLVKAMEEYKNQFIDFDGPISMIDHQTKLLNAKDKTIERLENELTEGVEIMSSIYHNVDKYHLNISFKNGELFDKLKDYLGV